MWEFVSEGDGRVMRLQRDGSDVLVIDRDRVTVKNTGCRKADLSFGNGQWPSWEDEKEIERLLNGSPA